MRKRDIVTIFFLGVGLVMVIWISSLFMEVQQEEARQTQREAERNAVQQSLGRNPNPRILSEQEKQEMLRGLGREEEPRNLTKEEKKGLVESLGRTP